MTTRSPQTRLPAIVLPVALSLLAAAPAYGQSTSQPALPPASRLEAMKQCDLCVGQWTGPGWPIDATDRRADFNAAEPVT